jgi:hypothetical protein
MMDQDDAGLALDSKLRRRGLLAGAAALGAAALFKIKGAVRAEASVLNDPILYGNSHVGTLSTRIASDLGSTGALVLNNFPSTLGVSTGDAIQARTDKSGSAGVRGIAEPVPGAIGAGVIGEVRDPTSVGVMGNASGSVTSIPLGAQGVGVFGMGSAARTAVKGEATNGYGVWGASNGAAGVLGTSPHGYAVQGACSGNGTAGIFTAVHGVGLSATSTNNVAMVGIGTNHIGVYAHSASAAWPALFVENVAGAQAAIFYGSVVVNGNFSVVGAKNALVPLPVAPWVPCTARRARSPSLRISAAHNWWAAQLT